jgi:hypothetical protein
VIVDPVIDQVSGDQRRYHHRRNARSVLFEKEARPVVLIGRRGIARSGRVRRGDMVIEPAVLIPSYYQETAIPQRRVANCLVGRFDEALPPGYIVEGVLRRAAFVMKKNVVLNRCAVVL